LAQSILKPFAHTYICGFFPDYVQTYIHTYVNPYVGIIVRGSNKVNVQLGFLYSD